MGRTETETRRSRQWQMKRTTGKQRMRRLKTNEHAKKMKKIAEEER